MDHNQDNSHTLFENDKSTDYQTEPTLMGNSNQQQNIMVQGQEYQHNNNNQNGDSVIVEQNNENDNQQQEEQDTYPQFQEERLKSLYSNAFEMQNSILSLRFSNNDQNIAIGQMNSEIQILNSKTLKIAVTLTDQETKDPCTSVRWCPDGNINNCLLSAYTNGTIIYWHTTSNKVLHRYQDPENPMNAMDISPDGLQFAAGGNDGVIRIYDVGKMSKPVALQAGDQATKHTNRVFGIKYDKANPHIVYTGGWDNNILIWDTRLQHSVAYIGGPRIHSDSIDINDNQLLAGSWRNIQQLELFDLRTYGRIREIQWENFSAKRQKSSQIYCCQFSRQNPSLIVAGCSGTNELRMFDSQQNYNCVAYYKKDIFSAVYALDTAQSTPLCAYGDADGQYGLLKMES